MFLKYFQFDFNSINFHLVQFTPFNVANSETKSPKMQKQLVLKVKEGEKLILIVLRKKIKSGLFGI